jgi:hypothetical protein
MVKKYPNKEDWYSIRWSDETYFGWGPEGPHQILRKRGGSNRYKPINIQRIEARTDTKEEANQKRVHFWGAIGYNFKSNLIEYSVPSNLNGKMSQEAYIDQIPKPEVSKWYKESIK